MKQLSWMWVLLLGLMVLQGCSSKGKSDDTTPNTFSFSSQTDAKLSTVVESNSVTIMGVSKAVAVTITGGEYSVNGGAFTSSEGTISEGQSLKLRVTSAAGFGQAVSATVKVGKGTGSFQVTTAAQDVQAKSFSFAPVTDAEFGAATESAPIVVEEINDAVAISIAGGEYRIDTGAFTSDAGTVSAGQSIVVRVNASQVGLAVATATLTLGEGSAAVSGTFSVTSKQDDVPPEVVIAFPPPVSMTEGSTVYVRGTANDVNGQMASLTVNGVAVTSDDDFATWSATVPVVDGENTVTVTAADANGNINNTKSVGVRKAALTSAFPDNNVPFDYAYNLDLEVSDTLIQAVVADVDVTAQTGRIVFVNLSTGERTIFIDNQNQANPSIDFPFGVLTTHPSYYFLADGGWSSAYIPEVMKISREAPYARESILFQDDFLDAFQPSALAYNPIKADTVYVGSREGKIVELALSSGDFSILSDLKDESLPPDQRIVQLFDIELDAPHNRIFALDPFSGLFTVDLDTGTSIKISDLAGLNLGALAQDAVRNRLLLAVEDATGSGILYQFDTNQNTLSLFSSPTIPDSVNPMKDGRSIATHSNLGYAVVADYTSSGLFAVDLLTGHRVVISKSDTSATMP